MNKFNDYLEHGWLLVPIPAGQKGPHGAGAKGWNRREKCLSHLTATDPNLRNAGLAHAYSGTCAIDVDDYARARDWLAERGVDLDALFMAPDAVQITSGRANHGKLIYTLPEPLISKQIKHDKKGVIDFRCATSTGTTVQDVLPPSIHPDTGEPYKWVYDDLLTDWSTPPEIPADLLKVWIDEVNVAHMPDVMPEKGASFDELNMLLKQQDPDMSRDEWVRVGMVIHHETDGTSAGLDIWDTWSQQSSKYVSRQDLETVWRSFHDTPNAVTIGALRQSAIATVDEFPDVTVAPAEDEVDPWAAQETQKRERFKLVPVSEMAQRPPPKWIVEGLIPQADIAMIYGDSGAGKSFVALDLAFSVANGYTWFNRATRMGTVIWIAAEAAGAMRNRSKAYQLARGADLPKTDLWIIEQNLSLMNKEDADGLLFALDQKEPSLIIVDTLAAASGGANENSGEDMNKVLDNCRMLHEATGALVLLIHHTGKDASKGARGWSGIKAAMHTEINVSTCENSTIRIMESTKQRDSIDGEQFPFKLQVVPLDMDGMDSCVVDPLDPAVLDGQAGTFKLSERTQLVWDVVRELFSENVDEATPVRLQDVYDRTVPLLPAPSEGGRDRRSQTVQRAVEKLGCEGLIALNDDKISLGSSIDD